MENFEAFEIKQMPQRGNTHVDSLATLGSMFSSELKMVILVLYLSGPNITWERDKEKN